MPFGIIPDLAFGFAGIHNKGDSPATPFDNRYRKVLCTVGCPSIIRHQKGRISLLAFGRLAVSIQNRVWTYRNVINGLSLLVGKQLDAY